MPERTGHECMRCGSDTWTWCDYRGCSTCRPEFVASSSGWDQSGRVLVEPEPPAALGVRLREIEARAENATEGPWYFDGRDIMTRVERAEGMRFLVVPLPETWHESQAVNLADAEFIAAAREDVPWLAAQLRETTSDRAPAVAPASLSAGAAATPETNA